MTPIEAFRANLRAARERRDLKQAEVAERIGMDPASYGKIEHGARGVSLDEAVACAAVLDAPLVSLVFQSDETFNLAPGYTASPELAYTWAAGGQPLHDDGADAYFSDAAPVSHAGRMQPGVWQLWALVGELSAAAAADDPTEMGEVLKSLERELDRQKDEVARRKRKKARGGSRKP